jgi:membrane protein YqaA with SNARE-associated domain
MTDFLTTCGYPGLFIACFLAATVLPFSSDIIFAGMIIAGLDATTSLLVAATGNWAGSMSTYALGRLGKTAWIEKCLRVKPGKVAEAEGRFRGKGALIAFFSFLPGLGDMISMALGYLRAPLLPVAVSMLVGKFVRYVAILYLVQWGCSWWAA